MTTQKITRDKLVQAISELESWERNRKNEGYGSRLSIREEFQLQAYKELLAAKNKSDFIKHIKRVAKEVNEWPESKRWMLSDARVATDDSAVELLATELMKRIDKITGERHSLATLSSLRTSIVEVCRSAWRNKTERGE